MIQKLLYRTYTQSFQCYPCMYILNLNGEKSQGDTCKRADENEKISANEIVLRIPYFFYLPVAFEYNCTHSLKK